MAGHADLTRAAAPAKTAEAGRRAESGERHEALEARPEVEAELGHRQKLNRRPAVAAQRKAAARLAGRPAGPRPVQRAPAPNRTGLPDRLKAGVEALSGVSMDGVKVHYNSSKPAQLNALAYAQGSEIHLAPGQERHLPHEAWHVIQQAQGRVRATAQMKQGISVNQDAALEQEAERMGQKALSTPDPAPDALQRPASPLGRALTVQLFSEAQVQAMAKSGGGSVVSEDTLHAARLKIIAEAHPQADPWMILELSRKIRADYVNGEVIERDMYKEMVKGLSEEQLAEAAELRKLKTGYDPATEDVEEGEREWASSDMNQALNELRKAMPQFTTGHHKVSKSKLAAVVKLMTPEQETAARKTLDLPHGLGVGAFKSLGSNVSTGPNSGLRLDEGGRRLDANRSKPGAITPRSTVLGEVDLLLDQILAKGQLTEQEYEKLIELLSVAEKLHYEQTKGEVLDSDVSMWLEIPTEPKKLSYWVRKSVEEKPVPDWEKIQQSTVRDLKNPKYRVKEKKEASPIPRLFAGEKYYRGDVVEHRFKFSNLYDEPSPEGRAAWAKSGHSLTGGMGQRHYTRVDPPEICAAFEGYIGRMGNRIDPSVVETFKKIVQDVEKFGNSVEFDTIRNSIVQRCRQLQSEISAAPDAILEQDPKAMALRLARTITWFAEGGESLDDNNAEIQTALNAIHG
jgi:hypothetical protein